MLNVHKLQMIKKNETVMTLLKFFHKCREISNETNLESFLKFLTKNMIQVSRLDYDTFFRQLEEAGVGYFEDNKAHLFIWNYSFNNIAEQILHPNKKVTIRSWQDDLSDMFEQVKQEAPKKPVEPPKAEKHIETAQMGLTSHKGRPKGSKNKAKVPKDVLFTFKTSKGEVSFDLAETVRLMKQVEQLKQTLKAS